MQGELADFVDGTAIDAQIQQEDLVTGFRSFRHRGQRKKSDEKSYSFGMTEHFAFRDYGALTTRTCSSMGPESVCAVSRRVSPGPGSDPSTFIDQYRVTAPQSVWGRSAFDLQLATISGREHDVPQNFMTSAAIDANERELLAVALDVKG